MKKRLGYFMALVAVPVVVVGGWFLFPDRAYAWIAMCAILCLTVPFFLVFERKNANAHRLTLLGVMIALAVISRVIFSVVPHFKPITAMIVIAGICLGGANGFLTGALSALLSGFFVGIGVWTPYQMFAWGAIGLLAGVLAPLLKRSLVALSAYGVLSGVFFSLFMDVYTVLNQENTFRLSRYLFYVAQALPMTVIYAVSNVIFLLLLARPIGRKVTRLLEKYGI